MHTVQIHQLLGHQSKQIHYLFNKSTSGGSRSVGTLVSLQLTMHWQPERLIISSRLETC